MSETLIYTTNQWEPAGYRQVAIEADCTDHDLLHEWVNLHLGEYPPEGYGTEVSVLPTDTGWRARLVRWISCD